MVWEHYDVHFLGVSVITVCTTTTPQSWLFHQQALVMVILIQVNSHLWAFCGSSNSADICKGKLVFSLEGISEKVCIVLRIFFGTTGNILNQ